MPSTVAHAGKPFGVTLLQLAPPSRVTCTSPSSVPTQIMPFATGDSSIEKIVP